MNEMVLVGYLLAIGLTYGLCLWVAGALEGMFDNDFLIVWVWPASCLVFAWLAGVPLLGLATLLLIVGWRASRRGLVAALERLRWQRVEARARALVLRDPFALVGYEQLAVALERQGRRAEVTPVLERWQARDPDNRVVEQWLARLAEPSARPRLGGEAGADDVPVRARA